MLFRIATALMLTLLTAGPALADEEYRDRRREIEEAFAPRYMDVATAAKAIRARSLVRDAFRRAEILDPGSDAVIEFDPEVDGAFRGQDKRKLAGLEKDLSALKSAEAKARAELAAWCDDEALLDESVAEAVESLVLAPGPVSFDERGILSEPRLGSFPESLSLSVLEEYEVYDGRLLPRTELPDTISWGKGWKLKTAHFDIETNVSGRVCRAVGRALEAAREIYAEMTGFQVEKRMLVYIVATRGQYLNLWKKLGKEEPKESNIGKCYGDFCGVDGSRSQREILAVSIHECAHGYLNLGLEAATGVTGATMPPWFHEGLATYCAGYGPDSLSFDRGVVLPRIARDKPLGRFQEMIRVRDVMPIAEFMNVKEGGSAFYHQACAFFWFWYELPEGDLKAAWRRAVKALYAAGLGEERIVKGNELFCAEIGVPLEEIEAKFLEWASGLDLED